MVPVDHAAAVIHSQGSTIVFTRTRHGADRLAKQLGISRGQAQEYVDLYFSRYPGVKEYMDRTREQAKEQGYVETVFGRRLHLPDINARQAQRRGARVGPTRRRRLASA